MKRTTTGIALIAAAASVAAASTPAFAGDYRGADCRYHSGNPQTTGTVIGAALGALIGNQAASRGSRGTGTVIGALAGGALGNVIGKSSKGCDGYASRYDYQPAYYGGGYDRDRYERHDNGWHRGWDRDGYGRYDARYDYGYGDYDGD